MNNNLDHKVRKPMIGAFFNNLYNENINRPNHLKNSQKFGNLSNPELFLSFHKKCFQNLTRSSRNESLQLLARGSSGDSSHADAAAGSLFGDLAFFVDLGQTGPLAEDLFGVDVD